MGHDVKVCEQAKACGVWKLVPLVSRGDVSWESAPPRSYIYEEMTPPLSILPANLRPAFDDILLVLTKMRASLNGRTMKMNVEAPKPGRTAVGTKGNSVPGNTDGFETGAQGVSAILPGSDGMAAISRFRFPPPLEAVEEGEEERVHSTDGVDLVPTAPAPAAAVINKEPSAAEGKEDA